MFIVLIQECCHNFSEITYTLGLIAEIPIHQTNTLELMLSENCLYSYSFWKFKKSHKHQNEYHKIQNCSKYYQWLINPCNGKSANRSAHVNIQLLANRFCKLLFLEKLLIPSCVQICRFLVCFFRHLTKRNHKYPIS